MIFLGSLESTKHQGKAKDLSRAVWRNGHPAPPSATTTGVSCAS